MDYGLFAKSLTDLKLQPITFGELAPFDILIKVSFAGLNRADVSQMEGNYPPPAGTTEVLGLECSGVIEKTGTGVKHFKAGDHVMALVSGGAFATRVVADTRCVLKIPEHLSFEEAAILPESLYTFWANAYMDGLLRSGHSFLVHGGASGLGSFSIQMAKALGVTVFTTANGSVRSDFAKFLGADKVVNTKDKPSREIIKTLQAEIGEKNVDVILDHVGPDYFDTHLSLLKRRGRLIAIDSLTGSLSNLDFDKLILKRLVLIGSVLRSRAIEEKYEITKSITDIAIPTIVSSKLRPKVDSVFDLNSAATAAQKLLSRKNLGKIALKPLENL